MALDTAHHHPLFKVPLIILAIVALLLGLWPCKAYAQDPAQEVLNAINAARAEHGLGPLALNGLLSQAAQNHVNDMITNYVYGHYGSDGSTVQMRVARTGYSATPWVSENWVSASSASGAMRWWMNDYIHRVNILTARWTEIGIGVGTRGSEMIFVTVFSAGGGASGEASIAAVAPPQEAPPPPSVRIEQISIPPEGLDYTIKPGDTLLAIGLRYGLPWESIAGVNGLDERSLLQIGQVIRIPGTEPVAPPPPDVKTEEYVVQPGDTLFRIAARRGMYWDEVAAVNGFGEHTVLQIGQVIKVPVVEEEITEVAAEPVAESATEMTVAAKTQPLIAGPHLPKQYTNFSLLAFDPSHANSMMASAGAPSTGIGGPVGDYHTVAMALSPGMGATSAVLAAHAVESELQAAEQSVQEVSLAAAPASEEDAGPTLYEVQPGDTIISIAIRHDLEWGALLTLNGLTESSILQPGQQIRLR